MIKLDLGGEWLLSRDSGVPIAGHLPGCTYLDYMANGMADPFWGENETSAKELANHDYCYTRDFEVTQEFLKAKHVQLVSSGLDTLCTLSVNGVEIAKTDNIHREWRFDVKNALKPGSNSVSIFIANPYPYMAEKHAGEKHVGAMGAKGSSHLRKVPCHFGWDWGPVLPPAGLLGSIALQSFDTRIEETRYTQRHDSGHVTIDVEAILSQPVNGNAFFDLVSPNGQNWHITLSGDKVLRGSVVIENPELWWPNGLGGQPLYTAKVTLKEGETVIDASVCRIGLRTIVLDTSPDDLGRQFRFIVNGVPIFAKGANWIPPDSFVTRTTHDDYAFYVKSAKDAGMNILRVWGGGMYERDDFYDLCDENGILVWQDFIFACGSYPLHNKEFLENVHGEVNDNVRRLRHHASLALWCGNNECEMMQMLWKDKKRIYKSNRNFYHTVLREWVGELDGVTPYWPGSPSSGSLDDKPQLMKPGKIYGDTHLWQVWHGMEPIEAFRNFPTRFCSEFGMESMPSMRTIRMFTSDPSPKMFDPVMKLHQKSKGGNEKILFYLLAKFRNPKKFEDYIYLTQLVQANTVRFAVDCWRRNIGKQNGAIFWQYNDCWPVASWAGIDYGKQYKAVQYHAKHFNKMICLSNDYFANRAEIYAVNEFPASFSGVLEWTLSDFAGTVYSRGSENMNLEGVSAKRLKILYYSEICKKLPKKNSVLRVTLKQGEAVVDSKNWLLVPDKKAALPKARLTYRCALNDGVALVELTTDYYARYVYLEAEDVASPWSDNFFDLAAGENVTVTVPLPANMDLATFQKVLTVKSLADVEPKNSLLKDRLLRLSMVLKENNYVTWLLFKLYTMVSK